MSSSFTLGDGDGPRPTPPPSGEPQLPAPCLLVEPGRAGTDTFNRYRFNSLSDREWCALLGFYRVLRIRIPYAAPGSDALNGLRANGCSYGMTRQEARTLLWEFAMQVDWYAYLGSK